MIKIIKGKDFLWIGIMVTRKIVPEIFRKANGKYYFFGRGK